MFAKPLTELAFEDIHSLVAIQRREEGNSLDYKATLNSNIDKAKTELAKDLSAFANSGGGYLIFGITDDKQITGIDAIVNNRPVAEWLNQCVNSQVAPTLFYNDPVTIPIPNTDKVVLVIHVPESLRKPHMVIDKHQYYVRVNDSAKPANHFQVRDMFDFSRKRTDELQAFFEKRNLDNEQDDRFLRHPTSTRIVHKEFSDQLPTTSLPKVFFSLIPVDISSRKIQQPLRDLKTWLNSNATGFSPDPSQSVFYDFSHYYEPKLDGTIFLGRDGKQLSSYFELLNNGFVEAGFSKTFVYAYKPNEAKVPIGVLDASALALYQMLFLGFARRLYEFIRYTDEFIYQISFVNVLNCRLDGFNDYYDTSRHHFNDDSNKHHPNFRLQERLIASQLTEPAILNIAKNNSELIHNAFGLEKEYCFVDNQLNNSSIRFLRFN